jgi:hypothetical protein
VQDVRELHLAPTTLANLYNTYDPTTGSATGRLVLAQVDGLANMVCQALFSVGGTLDDCRTALAPLLDQLNLTSATLPASSGSTTIAASHASAAPAKLPTQQPVTVPSLLDLLTGGASR